MDKTYLIAAALTALAEQIITFRLFYSGFSEYFGAWGYMLRSHCGDPNCSRFENMIDRAIDGDEYDGVFSPTWKLFIFTGCGVMTGIAAYKWLFKLFE